MNTRVPPRIGDGSDVLFEEDLSLSEPDPVAAPAWAQQW